MQYACNRGRTKTESAASSPHHLRDKDYRRTQRKMEREAKKNKKNQAIHTARKRNELSGRSKK